jgi:hypothetical protein
MTLKALTTKLALLACLTAAVAAQTLPLTQGPVLPLYRALRSVGLDPQQVYKIREATIDREDVHLFLNDGTIAFTQAVDGRVTGAYFEGDGEVLVRPPDRRERASLGLFTGQGILEEHFSSVYLRFNDDTARELQPCLRPASDTSSFVNHADVTAQRLAIIDAMRLAISFTSLPATVAPGEVGPLTDKMLHARIASERLGTFDVYYDTLAVEQIIVGQVSSVHDTAYYDLWLSFSMRSLRSRQPGTSRFHGPTGPAWTRDALTVNDYKIQAAIDSSFNLAATADLAGEVKQGGARILMFELSRYLQLKSVELAGRPLEFIQNETVEGSQLARRGNDLVAVLFPAPVKLGERVQLKFSYAGSVLSDGGGGLFYVGARGTWYPNRGIAMARYDITFRFPSAYTLVATGKRVSLDRQAAETIGHWISDGDIPIAGFNIGRYIETSANAGNIVIRSYATRSVERALPQTAQDAPVSTPQTGMTPEGIMAAPVSVSSPTPATASGSLARRAAEIITQLDEMLGPFPFSSLALTQRPGPDSQGWPGIVFLSSYVYLTPEERAVAHVGPADNVLYASLMMPHEVAHQWFGDRVSWASYHEQWLLEALVNYSAILLLEKTSPSDAQVMLQAYRQLLASKTKDGVMNVQAGPVTLGLRLASSRFPNGYEIITYGRGTWLVHMLREMFRDASRTRENPNGSDELFLGALRTIYRKYQGKEIANAGFEAEFEAVLPKPLWYENRRSLDWFFDGWVNGTAFPELEVKDARFSAASGKPTVTAILRQLDAPDDLVTSVPVYAMVGENKVYLGRVTAEGAETRFSLPAPAGARRLILDPYQTVLTAP